VETQHHTGIEGLRLDSSRPAPAVTVGFNGMSVLDSLPVLFDA
jgi:hypothetical protein